MPASAYDFAMAGNLAARSATQKNFAVKCCEGASRQDSSGLSAKAGNRNCVVVSVDHKLYQRSEGGGRGGGNWGINEH